MALSSFAMNMFNYSDSMISILVIENDNINVFQDRKLNETLCRTSDINFKVFSINEIEVINNEVYYIIDYSNSIKGYFKPKNSIILLPKSRRQAKVSREASFLNDINQYLGLNEQNYISNKSKIGYSSYRAFYDDKIYEGMVFSDELVGFFKPCEVRNLYKETLNFTPNKKAITYYDNELTKKGKIISPGKVFQTKYIIPDEKKLRFRYKNKDYWMDMNDVDIEYRVDNYQPDSFSEALIQSVIHQYKDKLTNYDKYYMKILKKGK